MPLSDYIVDITSDGSRQGLILERIDEKRQIHSDATIKNTVDMTAAEIADSDIIETEKVIYSPVSEIDEDGIQDQLGEFLDLVNATTPIDTNQGTGPFKSVQTLQLKQIPANRVLTHVDPTRIFNFEFQIQNTTMIATISGVDMTTYEQVVNELNNIISNNGGGGIVSYASLDYTTGEHGLVFKSNTLGQPASTDEQTNTTQSSITSQVAIHKLFDVDYISNGAHIGTSASTNSQDDNAEVYITLPKYDARSIITGLSTTETYSFTLERLNAAANGVQGLEGNQRARVVRISGNNVERLDLLIEEINSVLDGDAEIEFGTTIPNYALLVMKSEETGILGLSISVADLFHSMNIPFELSSPISGGRNLFQVLKFTWRYDQREWTRVIPYEWLEFRRGVATEARGQTTASGITSSGVIVPEGGTEAADTSVISTIDVDQTADSLINGTPTGPTETITPEGFIRSDLGIGLI